MRIGIICALEEEISLLRDFFVYEDMHHCGSIEVTESSMFDNRLFLTVSGVGKACAAAAAQALISELKCDIILNTGLAGSCSYSLVPGSVILVSSSCYHDFHAAGFSGLDNNTVFYSDNRLNAKAKEVFKSERFDYVTGKVATGDMFVSSGSQKDDIKNRTDCLCVDMELAAIAHIAYLNNVPYLSLKIISDNADETALSDFVFNLERYAAYCSHFIYTLIKDISY
ncbi:MAG: 5'-methylthioadenosine/S-adenosylhomocysteine nucleosidase [Oscillospiraceae bacterium]|nr:5'-methylthioadenosine/S-adenosylhomocysteine nucleosidase [Oscillospiraceae bacterium]